MKLIMENFNQLNESFKNIKIPLDDPNDTTERVMRLPTNLDLTKNTISLDL